MGASQNDKQATSLSDSHKATYSDACIRRIATLFAVEKGVAKRSPVATLLATALGISTGVYCSSDIGQVIHSWSSALASNSQKFST